MSERKAFGAATPLVQRVGRVLFVAIAVALPAYIAGIVWELNSGRTDAAAVHIDFVAFWAAAKLAVAGEAISAFDPNALVAAQSLASDSTWAIYAWHYPPSFHLLVMPLGWLSFSAAFAIFSACAFGAYIWALRGWANTVPGGMSLAVAAPPVAFVLVTGNTSLLWAAALLAGLSALDRGQAFVAGAMIALLTLKPQFGLLIPIALIARRDWRVIIWATLSTAAVTALTVAVFGAGYWVEFFRAMARAAGHFEIIGPNAVTMITWYAFSRQFGLDHDAALVVQTISLIGAAAAVGLVWSRSRTPMDLKIAVLCLATLISTPYAFQYELVLAVLGALFLARAGLGQTPAGRAWLAALWLLPVPGWLIGGLDIADYAAPVLTLSVAACTALSLRMPSAAAS